MKNRIVTLLAVSLLSAYVLHAGCGGATTGGGGGTAGTGGDDGSAGTAGTSDGGSSGSGAGGSGTGGSGTGGSGAAGASGSGVAGESGTAGTSGSGTGGSSGSAGSTTATSRGSGTPTADSVTVTGSFPNSTKLFSVTGFGPTRTRDTVSDPIRIYRPNTNTNLPLIIAFPGSANTTDEILSQLGVTGTGSEATSLIDATEPAIFIAIPNSHQAEDWDHEGGGTDPSNYFNTTTDNTNTNLDLLVVRQAIKEAIRAYSIDQTRVYTMGFSNGAFMASYVAMMIPERIAGFAERSGGWARCLPSGFKASTVFTSTSTTCSTILTQGAASGDDYDCTSSPAQPFNALLSGTNRVPGHLSHDNLDDSVSVYYTCDLASQMSAAGYTVETDIRHLSDEAGGRHGVPEDFITRAWSFLRTKSL